jgi:hypothetical protein
MLISTLLTQLQKGQATNSTDTAFSVSNTKATVTKPAPAATRTIISASGGVKDGNTLRVWPIGGGDNNDVVNVKVYGWNRVLNTRNPADELWVSGIICEVQGTLSSSLPGVAGQAVLATEFFCDTLTLTTGISVLHNGTADIDQAWFECDWSGFELAEIRGDLGAGGDAMNWLWQIV